MFEKNDAQQYPWSATVYHLKTGEQLLDLPGYAGLIQQIKKTVAIDQGLFDACYLSLMQRFAAFVQAIPESTASRAQPMLAVGMRRAFLLLQAFANHLQVTEGKAYLQSDAGARLLFAVFSAALLFELGKIASEKRMELCDDQGNFLAHWSPFENNMLAYGQYFKIRFGKSLMDPLLKPLTQVLAKKVMPELAFLWLTEDQEVLYRWFEALNVVDEFFAVYRSTCDISELLQKDPLVLSDVLTETQLPTDNLQAERFWDWIQESLNEGKLDSDQAAVVDGELILDIESLAKSYGRVFAKADHAVVLVQQFNSLGIAQMDGQDFKHRQYFSSLPGQQQKRGLSGHGSGLFAGSNHGAHSQRQAQTKSFVVVDKQTSDFILKSGLVTKGDAKTWSSTTHVSDSQDTLLRLEKAIQAVSLAKTSVRF